MKEKRKLRIIEIEEKKIRTLTNYKRFRKRLIKEKVEFYNYNRKNRTYTYFKNQNELIEFKEKRKKKKKEIKEEIEEEIPIQRIRKQKVLNFRSHDEPYAVSIRAITINPEINDRGLFIAINEAINQASLNFIYGTNWEKQELGIEAVLIPDSEDKRLNDNRVHIEIQIRKEQPVNYII